MALILPEERCRYEGVKSYLSGGCLVLLQLCVTGTRREKSWSHASRKEVHLWDQAACWNEPVPVLLHLVFLNEADGVAFCYAVPLQTLCPTQPGVLGSVDKLG